MLNLQKPQVQHYRAQVQHYRGNIGDVEDVGLSGEFRGRTRRVMGKSSTSLTFTQFLAYFLPKVINMLEMLNLQKPQVRHYRGNVEDVEDVGLSGEILGSLLKRP